MSHTVSESIGKFTPFGLTSIDAANQLVLKAIMEKDWEGMTDHLRILAYTPGDQELIELTDKHIKETKQQRDVMRVNEMGYVMADRFTLATKSMAYLKERNFELYRLLRVKMKAKHYLDGGSGISERDFKRLEEGEDERDEE